MTLIDEGDLEPSFGPKAGDPIKEYFRGVDETERREFALKVQKATENFDVAFDDASPPLPQGQRFAVVTMGTAVLAPCPVSPDESTLRLYGAFESREEAREHAQRVSGLEERYSVIVIPCGEWVMMPQDELYLRDADAAKEATENHVRRDAACRAREEEEIAEAIKGKTYVRAGPAARQEHDEEEEETTEAERSIYQSARRCPAGGEVLRQHLFLANIIKDPSGKGEAVFRVLGCFHTDEEVEQYTASTFKRREHTIYTFPTCEWICLNAKEERGSSRRKYEQPELEKIMNAALDNQTNVVTYKAWKAKKEAEHPGCFDEPEGATLIEDENAEGRSGAAC